MKQTRSFHFLVYLAGLSIVGLLATDMYLPAFDLMHKDLETSKANIGLSLTLYLGGYSVAQLLWGPISDQYGKPNAILLGLLIFVASSLGLFFIKDIGFFLALRLVQAIGACSAAVSWQALVIERYNESETNKIFASIMPLVALSPALAPLFGVFILEHFGWPSIFLVIAFIGFLLILYTLTLKRNSASAKSIIQKRNNSYLQFFKSRKYLGNVLIYGAYSAGFFAWLTGAPFFLKELGYSEKEIGWSFVPQTIAFMVGGYGYRFLADKLPQRTVLKGLLVIYSLSMWSILAMGLFTIPKLWQLLIPFCLMAFGNGATYPIVVAEALKPYKENSGKASALCNSLQLGLCFLASAVVSAFSAKALLATCLVMAATTIFTVIGLKMTTPDSSKITA